MPRIESIVVSFRKRHMAADAMSNNRAKWSDPRRRAACSPRRAAERKIVAGRSRTGGDRLPPLRKTRAVVGSAFMAHVLQRTTAISVQEDA
jgi:hypothetical protein